MQAIVPDAAAFAAVGVVDCRRQLQQDAAEQLERSLQPGVANLCKATCAEILSVQPRVLRLGAGPGA